MLLPKHAPVRTVAPAIAPVTLAEAKLHCRVEHSVEDTLLTNLIGAATEMVDGWTGSIGQALCEQTWRQDYDYWTRPLRLPLWPVISVSSVTYIDQNAATQTLSASNYTLRRDALGAYLDFDDDFEFPTLEVNVRAVISVTYVAGYEDDDATSPPTATVPERIRVAILLLVGHWYAHREAVGQPMFEQPMAVRYMLEGVRRVPI